MSGFRASENMVAAAEFGGSSVLGRSSSTVDSSASVATAAPAASLPSNAELAARIQKCQAALHEMKSAKGRRLWSEESSEEDEPQAVVTQQSYTCSWCEASTVRAFDYVSDQNDRWVCKGCYERRQGQLVTTKAWKVLTRRALGYSVCKGKRRN